VVVSVIPLSMLFGFMGMALFRRFGEPDEPGRDRLRHDRRRQVVMVGIQSGGCGEAGEAESIGSNGSAQPRTKVARPIVFAVAIIIAVYMPVFFLEGLEGRMFRPMAISVCSALLGSLILALTVVPAATSLVMRHSSSDFSDRWFHALRNLYERSLKLALSHGKLLVATSVVVLLVSIGSVAFIGTEFMARLDEGSILIESRKLPASR